MQNIPLSFFYTAKNHHLVTRAIWYPKNHNHKNREANLIKEWTSRRRGLFNKGYRRLVVTRPGTVVVSTVFTVHKPVAVSSYNTNNTAVCVLSALVSDLVRPWLATGLLSCSLLSQDNVLSNLLLMLPVGCTNGIIMSIMFSYIIK